MRGENGISLVRNEPSPTRLNLSPFEIALGMRSEPADRVLDVAEGDIPSFLAARKEATEAVLQWLLCKRLSRQFQRELATGPSTKFNVGDTVMLLRPPADKLTQSAIAPYIVVDFDERGDYYAVSLMGADGKPVDAIPTRAAAAQLRPFDMSRTSPEKEWLRLQWQAFGDDSCPVRAILAHRKSKRSDADYNDLEFRVLWITSDGDVEDWQPAHNLSSSGNIEFKNYIRQHRLVSRVRAQVTRERAKLGIADGPDSSDSGS